jgi:hypothetical protein
LCSFQLILMKLKSININWKEHKAVLIVLAFSFFWLCWQGSCHLISVCFVQPLFDDASWTSRIGSSRGHRSYFFSHTCPHQTESDLARAHIYLRSAILCDSIIIYLHSSRGTIA